MLICNNICSTLNSLQLSMLDIKLILHGVEGTVHLILSRAWVPVAHAQRSLTQPLLKFLYIKLISLGLGCACSEEPCTASI